MQPRRVSRPLVALASVAVLLAGAAACGDVGPAGPTTTSSTPPGSAEPVPAEDALALVADGADVIDVRTPEEFDAGHLDGALNIDFQSYDFTDRVDQLPRRISYVVYCASGNRATGAVEKMRELGFDVVNGGGYDDLVAAAG
ncbi:hypothetical protein ASG76_06200 [Nocardioides sp. Soil774]|uniref:rhodanese-like domain-containing protein n=1 Tax=Nocardioides sp. Soil774 TaxID=1736408 RepID=UPI0006F375F6|nr:rhodanese-like domain-containing protein [Nocardioides sp. Soil774]KRE95255.1 hypothetical protein ASG76_06200 [Nocardioides sp. Soil774]